MKTVVYYRVSTKRQGESGLGLEAQKSLVESFVNHKRAHTIAEFTEIESGKNSDRPELAKALARAKHAKATLVIAKLDRLARNVYFVSGLLESGVDFIACDIPEADRTMIQIYATFAEHEARRISERTKAALAAAKKRGVKLGSARPGHWKGREDRRLAGLKTARKMSIQRRRRIAQQHYADVAPMVIDWYESGLSLQKIADRLNDQGYRTRRDKPWNPMQVRRVISLAPSTN